MIAFLEFVIDILVPGEPLFGKTRYESKYTVGGILGEMAKVPRLNDQPIQGALLRRNCKPRSANLLSQEE
jgi:hypothetical protein